MRPGLALLGGLALGLMAASAEAAVMSYNIGFNAANFIPAQGSTPAPVDPVFGSLSIRFDPTLDYADTTAGISLKSLNLNQGSALSFTYDSSFGFLQIAGTQNGGDVVPNTNDFALGIGDFSTNPIFGNFVYAQTGANVVYFTSSGEVTATVVPLPPALLMLGSGLAGLGGSASGAGFADRGRAGPRRPARCAASRRRPLTPVIAGGRPGSRAG